MGVSVLDIHDMHVTLFNTFHKFETTGTKNKSFLIHNEHGRSLVLRARPFFGRKGRGKGGKGLVTIDRFSWTSARILAEPIRFQILKMGVAVTRLSDGPSKVHVAYRGFHNLCNCKKPVT